QQWLNRHMAALRDMGLPLRVHDVTFSQRLVVGLGASSVYETSLTLHHLYGVPYLPASSLKGMLAHYIVDQCFGGNEKEATAHPTYRAIFGTLQERGKVVFFDALPTKAPILRLDIMNPHYAPYYMNGSDPVDYTNPVPVPFFVVENATFRVAVGALPALSEAEASVLLDEVETHLLAALKTYGIGAKTAVGYGYASAHRPVSFPEEGAQR
ncbi:MAG: type III-B CRISPR module RAMP protein Cmr6, partial [Calditerricola sp.]|nr:type III-B CRISPR module RAMP protein Cmr6 [Calditerricola sp.]